MSTLAVRGVVDRLSEAQPDALRQAAIEFAPTAVLLRRIAAGEAADLGILTAEAVDHLVEQGTMLADSRVELADSPIGLAVRAGAAHPRIDSLETFCSVLENAPSIVYSRAGASGIFFAELIERLGLAGTIAGKATVIPSGFTAELVARGEAAVAIQQVSELLVVPGVEVVGKLPEGAQHISTFSAGIFAESAAPEAARALIAALASPAIGPIYEAGGLIPRARRP
jgi:molybdate transport system substrate-binding protein